MIANSSAFIAATTRRFASSAECPSRWSRSTVLRARNAARRYVFDSSIGLRRYENSLNSDALAVDPVWANPTVDVATIISDLKAVTLPGFNQVDVLSPFHLA